MPSTSTIADLKAALRDIDEKERLLDEQRRAISMTLSYFEGSGADLPQPVGSEGSSANLRDAIHEILSEDRPLHRRDIHDRLVERGVRIAGRDPVNNVDAHLSLDERFESLGDGQWTLAESVDPDEEENDRGWLPI